MLTLNSSSTNPGLSAWPDALPDNGSVTMTSTGGEFQQAEESTNDEVIDGPQAPTTNDTVDDDDGDDAAAADFSAAAASAAHTATLTALGTSPTNDLQPFRLFLFFPGT